MGVLLFGYLYLVFVGLAGVLLVVALLVFDLMLFGWF